MYITLLPAIFNDLFKNLPFMAHFEPTQNGFDPLMVLKIQAIPERTRKKYRFHFLNAIFLPNIPQTPSLDEVLDFYIIF